jgi:hypothetical protein
MNEISSEESDHGESHARAGRVAVLVRGEPPTSAEAQGHDSIGRVAGERGRRQSPLSSHVAYAFLIVGPGRIIVWMPQGLALTQARNQTILARIVCAP